MKRALILNYHALIGDESRLHEDRFSVRYSLFIQQMKLIRELAIPVISLEEWQNGEAQHAFSVALTFDDGHESDYQLAFPILEELNFPASFFPYTDAIGRENYMTWEMIKELSAHGFTIGSHGVSHVDLRTANTDRLIHELHDSKELIEQNIGKSIEFFALPFGGNNRAIAHHVNTAGYSRVLTTQRYINVADRSIQLHRWNIKSTTTMDEFEKMLHLKYALITRKKMVSQVNQWRNQSLIYLKNKLHSNPH